MRTKIVVLVTVLLALQAIAFAAPPPFLGKWKLVAVSTASGPVPKEKLAGGGMTWDFKADGKLDMTVTANGKTATATGTWTVDGDKISVTEGTQVNVVTFKKKGKQLLLSGTGKSTVVMTFAPTK
ncbi:MAG TPA: lipocalin family protein [Kofleriaceae bacterium]|nr:lipocalin family protein [Kofleriaceae bacterium]